VSGGKFCFLTDRETDFSEDDSGELLDDGILGEKTVQGKKQRKKEKREDFFGTETS